MSPLAVGIPLHSPSIKTYPCLESGLLEAEAGPQIHAMYWGLMPCAELSGEGEWESRTKCGKMLLDVVLAWMLWSTTCIIGSLHFGVWEPDVCTMYQSVIGCGLPQLAWELPNLSGKAVATRLRTFCRRGSCEPLAANTQSICKIGSPGGYFKPDALPDKGQCRTPTVQLPALSAFRPRFYANLQEMMNAYHLFSPRSVCIVS